MNVEEQLQLIEPKLSDATDKFIADELGIKTELSGVWYHYTQPENMRKIVESEIFHASFIRATSDPLEFALPLSACRDWVCLKKRFFDFPNFPTELFKHFNEQALEPNPRPYFVSLCKEPDLARLKDCYGNGIARIGSTDKSAAENFAIFGQLIECKYVENPVLEVFKIMDSWKNGIFRPLIEELKIDRPVDPEIMSKWFYIFMRLCLTIPLAIKQDSYAPESEVRLVVYSKDPDTDGTWYEKRKLKPSAHPYGQPREYLSLKLSKIGLVASEHIAK